MTEKHRARTSQFFYVKQNEPCQYTGKNAVEIQSSAIKGESNVRKIGALYDRTNLQRETLLEK